MTYTISKNRTIKKSLFSKAIFFLLFCSIYLPLVNAVSINISSSEYLEEGNTINANVSIFSSPPLNVSLYFTYKNIESTFSSLVINDSNFVGEFYNYSWNIKGMSVGTYSIFAELNDRTGNIITAFNKTGNVNSSSPKIIFSLPSGLVNKDNTLLIVKTNELAYCKYDTNNLNYENMPNNFSNTGSINHNQTISGLSNSDYTYYVRCQDFNGYAMNESYVIKFKLLRMVLS